MGYTSQFKIGDLIRWIKPLYYIENGREYSIKNWNYGLVIGMSFTVSSISGVQQNLTLQLLGEHSPMQLCISADMLLDVGTVERLGKRNWVSLMPGELVIGEDY